MQDRPTFGVLSNQPLCHLCSAANTTENFSEINLERKKNFGIWKNTYHTIFIYEKMFIIEISYNVLYVCTYDVVWNCMTRSFSYMGMYDKNFRSSRDANHFAKIWPKSLFKNRSFLPV